MRLQYFYLYGLHYYRGYFFLQLEICWSVIKQMSKDAVFLAWGNPNTPPVTGQQNGAPYEKWVYVVYDPVLMSTVGVGAGCWHRGCWYGGVGSSTAYVPREAAWVMFQNDKVTSWESRKR